VSQKPCVRDTFPKTSRFADKGVFEKFPYVRFLQEGVLKMSLRGAKRRSNPRKSVGNKEIDALHTVARNDKAGVLRQTLCKGGLFSIPPFVKRD
jgi:hypothetical protein